MARTNWPLVLLLWVAGLGAAGQYAKISVIFDQLGAVYPEAGTALGFVVSLVGAVGIVLGVAAGVLVARIGYKRAILGGLWVGAVMSLLQALFPPLPVFLGLRLFEGAAHLALVVAVPTIIAQVSSEAGRGLAMTLWSTFFAVSFALLTWLGLPLVARFGLSALFLGHGVFMALMALILAPRLPQLVATPSAVSLRELGQAHLRLYRSPRLAAPALGWLAYTTCFLSFLTVIPPFLPEAGRALIMGAMPLASIATSLTVGVWAINRVGSVVVIMAGFGLCAALSMALVAVPGAPLLALLLGASFGLVQGASFTAVPELNPATEDRALANGGLAQMGNLGNTFGTPILLVVLSVAGYGGMMVLMTLVFILGGIVHLWLGQRRRGDA